MSPKTREDFAPDIGGFLDGVSGEIVKAEFKLAEGKYADQVLMGGGDASKLPVQLVLTIESPDLDKPAVQGYSVGSQEIWEIGEDGKSITHAKNPEKHAFRKGSLAWHLVEAMFEAVGNGDMEKGQDFFINRDKYMTDAAFFTGLSFDWEVTEIEMEIGGKDKKVIKSRPPLPVKFNGETKKTAAGKATKASATVAGNAELDKILVENASGKSDRDLKTFAVHNKEMKANDAYIKLVISGKKMKELEDSGTLIKDPDSGKYL